MKKDGSLTQKEILDYLAIRVMDDLNVPFKSARSLVLDSLTYSVVIEVVITQCDFLLHKYS